MAITQDASTPTVSTGPGTTTPLTSPSFSPPSGSLVLVLAGAGWSDTGTVGMTVTDSGSHTWTNPVTCIGHVAGNGGGVGEWYSYFPAAPGSITVSVAFTGLAAGSGGRMLRVVVLTGAASSQTGAATASNSYNATTGTVSVTTTTTGSLVWGISDDTTSNHSWAANGATTLDSDYNDTTDTVRLVAWKATSATGTPGATTLGGTWSGSGNTNQCAFEVLPATGSAVSLTGDTPSALREGGPLGVLTVGVTLVGDTPSGVREGGPSGSLAIGVTLTGDTPSATRFGGPVGTVTADGLPVTLTGDTPSGVRMGGPSGTVTITVTLTGDTAAGLRAGGPSGTVTAGSSAVTLTGSTPSALRFSGPTGTVTAATMAVLTPTGTPPTQVQAWHLWVAETRSGKMLWELPATSFTWNNTLGDVGTIRATLAVESAWDALADQDERDPRVLLRMILTSPWRLSLVLRWGAAPVWAGPLVTYSRQDATSIDVGGSEVAKLLDKRTMVADGATSATDPTADLAIGPGTKRRAAYVLLTSMLTGSGNDLPITLSDPGGFGDDQRTYLGSDLASYGEKLTALSAEDDGPEIRYDPVITPGSDGDYLSWAVRLGDPYVGVDTTIWTFDLSSAPITEDMDASTTATGVWVAGSGQDRDKLISHTTDDYLVGLDWPRLESVDTSHNSETVLPRLDSYAAADLAAYSRPILARTVMIPTGVDPMPGSYRVGEHLTIDVRGDPIIPDGRIIQRIATISGDQSPWVTITCADPLPGVS